MWIPTTNIEAITTGLSSVPNLWRKKNDQLARIRSPCLLSWNCRLSTYPEDLVDAITTTFLSARTPKILSQRNFPFCLNPHPLFGMLCRSEPNSSLPHQLPTTLCHSEPIICCLANAARQLYPFLSVPLWNTMLRYHPFWHGCCSCCLTMPNWT